MEVAKESLPSNAVTDGGVTLDSFAARGRKAGGTAPGKDAGGAGLPQQNLGSAPHVPHPALAPTGNQGRD